MIRFAHPERWLSGRKRQIANLLYGEFRTEGSNPSLSVFLQPFAGVHFMGKKCQLTGKKANNAFAVSHSHRRTKKLQEANLQWKRVWWPQEKRWVKLRLSTKAIKTLEKKGLATFAREAGINLNQA